MVIQIFAKEFSAENLKGKITTLIVDQHLSFQIVESEAFLALVHFLNQRATIHVPKADCMIAHVMNKYVEAKIKITKLLSSVNKISLTCDVWTPPNSKSILGVTGHWLTNDWVMKDILLDAIEIKGSHSGENIGKHLYQAIEKYAIRDKNFCITTDNATNNTTMALYLEQFLPQFRMSQN